MYAELKAKTNFSFLEGASHPEELIKTAHALGITALGINDRNGIYGIPKAYWAGKDLPIKLIVGADVTMKDYPSLTFLCRDKDSYAVLCRLITRSHADKEKGEAHLTFPELIAQLEDPRSKNLLCLGPAGSHDELLKELFQDRLYIPLSRFKDGFDKKRTLEAFQRAQKLEAPIVATNDVLFHRRERKPMQDSLSCIREKTTLPKAGYKLLCNGERYLKSPFEMKQLFKDLPQALKETLHIADSCTFSMSELKYRYPSEWIPQNHTALSYLEELCYMGAKEVYKGNIPEAVYTQLRHELKVIAELNYADYFLTIYDIVAFARSKNILCQGRGSAANSVVCYCIGVTAVDPIRMNLLFERFISVERNEPPDIDVDFEHDRREEVIQYIYAKYGRDRAAMVSAVVTYQHRSMFRELCKVFDIDVGTLSAKKVEKNFGQLSSQSSIPNCAELIPKLAEEMKGFPRHISIHSGGFTLSADPIIDMVPVEPARMEGRTIVQFDKYDLDYLGLLKIDVLSLGMLSALRRTLDMVGMKLHEVPPEDSETFKMIQQADTVGTFQVESRAQMNMSGRLQPTNFYDLVIQIAIVRPGPIMGKMVHPYLKRRFGIEPVVYPHPSLKVILGRTLGVPLFQEQVMKMAIQLGGFTPGEADKLRRAIGAWRSFGSIQEVAGKLMKGFKDHGISDEYANLIFEQMKGFAHYGFPESHSASFALLTYSSCYLKRHFPAEFTCGLINSQPMGFYATHTLIDDARRHGVEIRPIDPNISQWDCTLEDGALRLGLRLVKGLPVKDAEKIIQNRPYHTLNDFLSRNHLRPDVLQRFAMGDGFKTFGDDQRHTLWKILSHQIPRHQTQLDFLSTHTFHEEENIFKNLSDFESINHDYEAFSSSARSHPMKAVRQVKNLPKHTTASSKLVKPGSTVTVSGLLLVRQKPPTANGVCFGAIEDETGFLDITLFPKEYEKFREVFLHNCFLILTGTMQRDRNSYNLLVKNMKPVWKTEETEGLVIEPAQYFW
ncbi:MAG: error-prone DNA polymerase [Bdellovibrionota bacterium]